MPDEPATEVEFSTLYRATIAPLRRYLTRMLGNPSEAQDVAHDAYVRVFPAMGGGFVRKPEALLYTAARRLAINRLRRRGISPVSREAMVPETAASPGPDAAQEAILQQELELLQTAIADLPEGCRAVLLLRRIEQLSHREIADRLGIAVSTVEKQHARALRLLRESLEGALDP